MTQQTNVAAGCHRGECRPYVRYVCLSAFGATCTLIGILCLSFILRCLHLPSSPEGRQTDIRDVRPTLGGQQISPSANKETKENP